MDFTLNTLVQRDPDQEFSMIDNEVVMLSLKNGEYYALNEVASKIWDLIKEKVSVEKIIQALMAEYEVDNETCYRETVECLAEFENKTLLRS